MLRVPVVSTSLQSVGYDAATSTLEVEFKASGKVYQYMNVHARVYRRLLGAPSKGSYFNAYIRNVYPERPLGSDEEPARTLRGLGETR